MEHIKVFNEHNDYLNYINSSTSVLPNLSYCIDAEDCHLTEYDDPRLIIIYNVTNISNPTTLINLYNNDITDYFNSIEIDGNNILLSDIIKIDVAGTYQFESTGKHVVKYELIDNIIHDEIFGGLNNIFYGNSF